MKQIILIFLLLPFYLNGQSHLISNIPLPKSYVMNLDPYPCDEVCMQEYLDNGMIFSFLSHADSQLENCEHNDVRMINISILNLGSTQFTNKLKIAMLLPYKKIGRYASSTINAAFAYLITKNHSFELKTYKIENENHEDIVEALNNIESDGFNYIIAPFTITGATVVAEINPNINIYFPTIHKKNMNLTTPYLYYGAIDYEAQSDLLLKEAVSPLVIFNDKSSIGKKLSSYQEDKFKNTTMLIDENSTLDSLDSFSINEIENRRILDINRSVINFSIPRRTTNLESKLKENLDINDGSFFINTPVVKTGMIMSQLTLYDTNTTNILSTQINYDPLLLSMTQYDDRKKMIIANSITKHHNILIDANSLLGNDIVYDWINYTTTVGTDYFFNLITNESREYNILVEENQMMHEIELLQPVKSRFIKHITPLEK
ncbi:MAG: hypothetical protein U9P72_00975 [Campylobacterota bacterium]|nr:hypothetical protein [Campylobacterota bacterium]